MKIAAFGQNQRLILRRSQQMEALVIQEMNKVLRDFQNDTDGYEGQQFVATTISLSLYLF